VLNISSRAFRSKVRNYVLGAKFLSEFITNIQCALIDEFGNILIPLTVGTAVGPYPRINDIRFWLLLPFFRLLIILKCVGRGAGT